MATAKPACQNQPAIAAPFKDRTHQIFAPAKITKLQVAIATIKAKRFMHIRPRGGLSIYPRKSGRLCINPPSPFRVLLFEQGDSLACR